MTAGSTIVPDAVESDDKGRKGRPGAGQDPVKRKQIIDGAGRIFIKMGFDAASMNDITREAGVSKGTIYVYFASKEELFEALIEEERTAIFANLYEALERGEEIRETLVRYGTALARKITSPTVLRAQRTVIGICERMPELGARFYERGPKRGHEKLAIYLQKAADAGILEISDVHLAAYQLADLCLAGLFRQYLFGFRSDPLSEEEIARVVSSGVDMFLKTYSAKPAA